MNISRRKFLTTASLAAGAVLQLNGLGFGQSRSVKRGGLFAIPERSGDPLAQLTWNSFLPFVHTDFSFGQGGSQVVLKLTDMVDTRPVALQRSRAKKGECFMLKFTGPRQQPLTQGTYAVNHFSLGDFNLFITDGGTVGMDNYYIAVINRVIS